MWWPWFHRGQIGESREYLKFFLSLESEVAAGTKALALNGAGFLAHQQGEYEEARGFLEQSLVLFEALHDPLELGAVLHNLANVTGNLGDYVRSRSLHQRALAARRLIGHKRGVGWSLIGLAELARMECSHGEAAALQEESLWLFQEVGDQGAIAWALNELGRTCQASGDLASPRRYLKDSLLIRRARADRIDVILSLETLAGLNLHEGRAERAAQLLGAAQGLRQAMGTPPHRIAEGEHERAIAALQEVLSAEVLAGLWADGQTMTLEQAECVALEESECDTKSHERSADTTA